MEFRVVSTLNHFEDYEQNQILLVSDNWDDWFEFETLFKMYFVDILNEVHTIGYVKIAEKKQKSRSPDLPETFNSLGDDFYSLGQEPEYYENLNKFAPERSKEILTALSDLALNLDLLDQSQKHRVIQKSLMRSIQMELIKDQFHRLATNGGAKISDFSFGFLTTPEQEESKQSDFRVSANSNPPTNIHVLVGRNGVGKSHLLNQMVRSYCQTNPNKKSGEFTDKPFLNVVLLCFSAFETKYPMKDVDNEKNKISYTYVGLMTRTVLGTFKPKSPDILLKEFIKSAEGIIESSRVALWKRALEFLESDRIFTTSNISELTEIQRKEDFYDKAKDLFQKLSSGHQVVLLSVTKLIETVVEKTLVLIDEPEAHLHPPLLSAYIRCISDLMKFKNGVALVATHSPVVLQEIPKNCCWIVERSGVESRFKRPTMETFGENIGIIIDDVFGLELTHSGYHKMIESKSMDYEDYDNALNSFDGQLGSEGKAILRALISNQQDYSK